MRSKEDKMIDDLSGARAYSRKHRCTVWAMSNGNEIIWSDSRSQVEREGFFLCSIFECGYSVDI